MSVRRETYFRNPLPSALKVEAIYTVHYFRYGKNFKYPLESHPFWELVFIDSGKALITADERKFSMVQGEICFHAPDVVHTIATEEDFSNSVIVSFDASGRIMSFLENRKFTLDQKQKAILKYVITEAKKTFEGRLDDPDQTKMVKKERAPFGSLQVIKNLIELLLLSIIQDNLDGAPALALGPSASGAHANRITENVIAILNKNLTGEISLDDIARQTFFSKTYLKAVFKKETGTSIIRYFNGIKIEEAKKLISLNKYTVTEITQMLGFSSVHYFSRLFKQYTDMTPTEYARSIRAENVLR